ncbi:FecR family protein [Spirosoma areae]
MAEEQQPIDDALIGNYLSGEATPAEAERVRRWLANADQSNRNDFAQTEQVWNLAGQLSPSASAKTDAAWQKVRAQLHHHNEAVATVVKPLPVEPTRPLPARSGWQIYGRVAAIAIVTVFSGLAIWQLQRPANSEAAAPVAVATTIAKRSLTLPDGSVVLLNRNSRLTYPATFADSGRVVSLVGEAFFDVTPNPLQPFYIRAGGATVRVLGTSFSVRAVGDSVRVAVRTGRVQLAARRQAIVLTPNQQATYLAPADTIRRALRPMANALAFQTGKLTFTNESLVDVARTLHELYGTTIQLTPSIRNCRLTASFTNESLDEVLTVIAESLTLAIRRDEGHITLDGAGCQ